MRRAVWVVVLLGVLGLAGSTALAHDFGGWQGGGRYPGYNRPRHYGSHGYPRVVMYPPAVVAPYPAYRPYGRAWGYAPYPHGVVQYYGRGLWFSIGF